MDPAVPKLTPSSEVMEATPSCVESIAIPFAGLLDVPYTLPAKKVLPPSDAEAVAVRLPKSTPLSTQLLAEVSQIAYPPVCVVVPSESSVREKLPSTISCEDEEVETTRSVTTPSTPPCSDDHELDPGSYLARWFNPVPS